VLAAANGATMRIVHDGPEFRTAAFERVRRLIRELAGISLGPTKRTMAYNRLARRLQATGQATFEEYLDLVEGGDPSERVEFTNALTTNLTSFFREPYHFPILVDHMRALPRGTPPVVWSSACSTGEEPYSIAMALIEAGDGVSSEARVIASDLDTAALERARAGVYPVARAAAMGEERMRRFFLRGEGSCDGYVKVRPEVRARVEFRHINLCEAHWPVEGPLAAVFCRNAMIYFDRAMQVAVLRRFHPLIEHGGLLFAGHSENFHYIAGDFLRSCGRTVYKPAR
jgi:chemotaxis protein methyltransferase CheR